MKKKQLTYRQHPGFKTPENYFERFDDRLFSKMNTAPISEEKIVSGFSVPADYFQKFEVEPPKQKEIKVISIFNKRNIKYVASIAAMFLFIFSIYNEYEHKNITFSTIEYGSVETYIENDHIDFSKPEMERILSQDLNISQLEFAEISDDAIFDYLIDNSNELSSINP